MLHPVVLAVLGAAFIAMCSAFFGVGIARLVWADDLKQAQRIDEIRSKTEQHLNGRIEALNRTVAILQGNKSSDGFGIPAERFGGGNGR